MTYTTDFKVYVDWDRDGYGAGDEITTDVLAGRLTIGLTNALSDRVASIGEIEITLDNRTRKYSPLNTTSPLYGRLLPNLPMQVEVWNGASYVVAFTGVTKAFKPSPGLFGDRTCELTGRDALAQLQIVNDLALPILKEQTADVAIGIVISQVYGGDYALGALDLRINPTNGDTVTVGSKTYRFVTALAQPNDVKIGISRDATMANLMAAINAADGQGTTYAEGTTKNDLVIAETLYRELPVRWRGWHHFARVVSGNAISTILDSAQDVGYTLSAQSPSANGNAFEAQVWLAAGQYKLHVLGRTSASSGRVDWTFDGATIASGQDWYSAATTYDVRKSTATFTVAEPGVHVLRGTINGKNGASSGYDLYLTKYWIVMENE